MNTKLSITDYAAKLDIDGSAADILRFAANTGAVIGIYGTDGRPAGEADAPLEAALEFAEIDRSLVYIVIG